MRKHGSFKSWLTIVILDGSSEYGAHVWSELGSLISVKHLFTSLAVSNLKFICNKYGLIFFTRVQYIAIIMVNYTTLRACKVELS